MDKPLHRWPTVEFLFTLVVAFSSAAFYSRGAAYLRWSRGEATGHLGSLGWLFSVIAFAPFLFLIWLAPNPELSEKVARRERFRQILMFVAMGIIFALEVFFLTF